MFNKMHVLLVILMMAAVSCAAPTSPSLDRQRDQINLSTLLDDMLDRSLIAEFPAVEFLCKQASSYDRASLTPGNPEWFAN
ncbi:MAG: hypothetical protein J7K65_10160, partial [Planctomycetes bacterium]|nr:hypothetical protein [Planctomycetota bacterium]